MKLLSKIPKKALIAAATTGTAIAVGVAVAIPKEESYRTIQVYDIEGTAQVTREDMGLMDAYVNMQLQNKDQAETGNDSYVQMKMDEDKYLLMEPDTSISIEATGNDTDSKTKIVLKKGAIVNRIEKKLSENSTYEVETPNSTMAVRGTQFRVAISEPDENGNVYTTLEVYEGSVESVINEKNPDGTITQKKVIVSAGKKILIRGNAVDAEYVGDEQDIVYDYDNPVLNFIGYLEGEPETIEEENSFVEAESSMEEESSIEETTVQEETTTESDENVVEAEPQTTIVEESIESDSDLSDEESISQDDGSSSSGSSSGGDNTSSGGATSQPASYTVTFTYGGITFATQTVTENGKAQVPELCPTAAGRWIFDFATPITQDTTIVWEVQPI